MHQRKADYTNTFCHLMNNDKDEKYNDNDFQNWKKRWKKRLLTNNNSPEKYLELMKSVNPLIIPRNHKVEEALNAAGEHNLNPINQLIDVLSKPYTQQKNIFDYKSPAILGEKYQTFCGT